MADARLATTPRQRRAASPPPVSTTTARYLEAVFYIEAEGDEVRAARLAEWLGVAQPTVSATLQRLRRAGLVAIAPAKTLTLTAAGRRQAAAIVRRHRIAERWLTDVIGLDWAQADEEASRLEHALSDAVADRIHALIGRPATCPHGNPIPGVRAPRAPERPLSSIAPGETARVQRISEVAEHEAPELLRFLGAHGFGLGTPVTALAVNRAAGTLTVRVKRQPLTLSLAVAEKVQIEPARRQPRP